MKNWVVYAIAGSVVTVVLHLFASISWGWSALAAFVGWPLVGTLITLDDDLPGGFSNPDGTTKPDWLGPLFWAQLVAGLAIASTVAALDVGVTTSLGVTFVGAALAAAAVAILLGRRDRDRGG